jgi:hypothetical protein
MKKNRGRKSRASVPLKKGSISANLLSNIVPRLVNSIQQALAGLQISVVPFNFNFFSKRLQNSTLQVVVATFNQSLHCFVD